MTGKAKFEKKKSRCHSLSKKSMKKLLKENGLKSIFGFGSQLCIRKILASYYVRLKMNYL